VDEFGPWLFATALLGCLTAVFLVVPNSRKWFLATIGAILLAALVAFGMSFISVPKGNQEISKIAEKATPKKELSELFIYISEQDASMAGKYVRITYVKPKAGDRQPVLLLSQMIKGAQKAIEVGDKLSALLFIRLIEQITNNPFTKFQ
jgi:hypothetical protein